MPAGNDVVTGTVSELRLGLQTGPGFKAQKDFVLKDVPVYVNDDKTSAAVWLGPRFVEKYFTDGVYGYGADGGWRLHGRVKPEDLDDVDLRRRLLARLEIANDPRRERYLQLLAVVNGWQAPDSLTPALNWFIQALRARTPSPERGR